MQQSFEYLKVQTAMDSVTVEDTGNVVLHATNDFDLNWYLSINTDIGQTVIKEFGPIHHSLEVTKYGFNYNLERKEYNEKYIGKRINSFLNDPKREITQVEIIDQYELEENLEKVRGLV